MTKSILKWELFQRRYSIFWWSLGVAILVAFTLAFYPTIRDQAAELNKSFGNLSGSTSDLFGGTDFFSPVGYLNSQLIYFTLPLLLIILGVSLGSSLIGREETEGTIEVLLSRPLSRTKLLFSKALSGGLIIFIVTLISSLVTIGMSKLVSIDVPIGNITLACVMCLLLVLTFSSLTFALTATGRGRVAALGISIVYALGGYIISSLAASVHWLKTISVIFPYHYYQTAEILNGTFHWTGAIFFIVFTTVCLTLSWFSFRRRDIV